jgi:type II secretory pathway component PulK
MEKQTAQTARGKCRKNERGAALITVLMISFLLIVAAAALLFAASANTSDVTDATAEEQAYYAAESGINRSSMFCAATRCCLPRLLI